MTVVRSGSGTDVRQGLGSGWLTCARAVVIIESPAKGRVAGEHLVADDAEGVHVAGRAGGLALAPAPGAR